MKILISGHRQEKLLNYDSGWIKTSIKSILEDLKDKNLYLCGYSGMASGVDLWFCQSCNELKIPYIACVPFDGQEEFMEGEDKILRSKLINLAIEVKLIRNSGMIEKCDIGIVVFDGNKGGTHNVFQQLIEKNMPFYWINPVGKKVWECF